MPFVKAGDVRLHYVEHGSGPEPLVFVHGYTSSRRVWEHILPRLPGQYRAFAFDLRGAGESDKPEGGYGPPIFAEDIHLATLALGLDSFTYIGHSMGGVTGMQLAVSHPQRLRRLVLVAPAPSGGVTTDPADHTLMKAIRGNRELRRRTIRALAVRPTADSEIERRIEDNLRWPEAAYDEAWEAMRHIRISGEVARIETPTLMVVGDRDTLRAANLEDAQRIPNCALQVFYRVGHEIPHDVPDELVAVLDDFIQNGAAAPMTTAQRAELVRSLSAAV
jgi:pimeloyl-ACP methyl ester carboxylesterase